MYSVAGMLYQRVAGPFLINAHLLFLQKFRFCGDLDCPDWLLAEISILSKLVGGVYCPPLHPGGKKVEWVPHLFSEGAWPAEGWGSKALYHSLVVVS